MHEYLISAAAVATTSIVGGYFTKKTVKSEWYKCIKPRKFTPPNIIFPIVWTVLYFTIFLALADSIREKYTDINILISLSLVLNVAWCYLYFGKKNITGALIIIFIMIFVAITTIIRAIKHNNIHLAKLTYPYLAWICFAMVLNALSISKIGICSEFWN